MRDGLCTSDGKPGAGSVVAELVGSRTVIRVRVGNFDALSTKSKQNKQRFKQNQPVKGETGV